MIEPESAADDPTPTPGRPAAGRKRRRSILGWMAAVALAAFLLAIVRPTMVVLDATRHGPATRAFNQRLQQLADEANLVGRPESDVSVVLGEPTEIRGAFDHLGRRVRRHEFAPTPSSSGRFQVECHDGLVLRVRQLVDD